MALSIRVQARAILGFHGASWIVTWCTRFFTHAFRVTVLITWAKTVIRTWINTLFICAAILAWYRTLSHVRCAWSFTHTSRVAILSYYCTRCVVSRCTRFGTLTFWITILSSWTSSIIVGCARWLTFSFLITVLTRYSAGGTVSRCTWGLALSLSITVLSGYCARGIISRSAWVYTAGLCVAILAIYSTSGVIIRCTRGFTLTLGITILTFYCTRIVISTLCYTSWFCITIFTRWTNRVGIGCACSNAFFCCVTILTLNCTRIIISTLSYARWHRVTVLTSYWASRVSIRCAWLYTLQSCIAIFRSCAFCCRGIRSCATSFTNSRTLTNTAEVTLVSLSWIAWSTSTRTLRYITVISDCALSCGRAFNGSTNYVWVGVSTCFSNIAL
jgi:hypothetical protein